MDTTQAKYMGLFQGPYLLNRNFRESILSRDQVNNFGCKSIQNVLMLLEEYSEKCLVPTIDCKKDHSDGSEALLYGCMSAEGVRELCFINAVMNSLCDVIQIPETEDVLVAQW